MMKRMRHSIMVFMSKRMIACDEASFLISYQKDHRLGLAKWMRLKMHLLSCHLCRKYAIQVEQLDKTVSEYRVSTLHEPCYHHLSNEACDKMQHAVEEGLNAK
jgi:hypothetical protein